MPHSARMLGVEPVLLLLLKQGVEAPILVLDHQSTFEDNRTQCSWYVEPTPFIYLALKEGRTWDFASDRREATSR